MSDLNERIANLTPKQRAVLALKMGQARPARVTIYEGARLITGDGSAIEDAGGYSDLPQGALRKAPPVKPTSTRTSGGPYLERRLRIPQRLSYKEQRELDALPATIEGLHGDSAGLEQALADPALYGRDRAGYEAKAARLAAAKRELAAAEERWLELEGKREALEAAGRESAS